jgi:hypothetical protein
MNFKSMKLKRVPFEQILAILGAVFCLAITILIWGGINQQQSMWPAPGLYFIEIVAICVAAAGLLVSGRPPGRAAVWFSAGIVLAFSLLAAFSVGLYYFPVGLGFIIAGLVADRRAGQPMLGHMGFCIAGGIAQAVLILVLAHLLY